MIEQLFFRRGTDPIVRLIVTHWILGSITGIGCALLLLAFDTAGLRSLLFASDMRWVGLLLLCSGFAVTFGSVISASAVMLLPGDKQERL